MTEEVEVVEAVPSDEHDESSNNIDEDMNKDQITMESSDQNDSPQKKLPFGPPSRNNNPNIPPHRGKWPFLNYEVNLTTFLPLGNGGSFYNNHKPHKNKPNYETKNPYNGPPPPPPKQAMEKYDNYGPPPSTDTWPVQTADTPKIQSLDVKCERNLMKVFIGMYCW